MGNQYYTYRGTEPHIPAFDTSLCNTHLGVLQHARLKTPYCDKCRDVYNAEQRARRTSRKAVLQIRITELSTKLDSAGQKKTAPAVLPTLNSGA